MSNTAVVQTPKEKQYGLATQAAWGTGVLDSAAYIELDCPDTEINLDVKSEDNPGAHGTRTPRESDINYHTKGSQPTLSIPAMKAKHDELDLLLRGISGQVVEGATTPFNKVFTPHSTQPNFSSDEGQFFTLIERDPAASKSIKMIDSVVKQVKFGLSAGQYATVESEFHGRGFPELTSNPVGTWTRSSNDFWHHRDLAIATINFGAGAVNVRVETFELLLMAELAQHGHGSGTFGDFGWVLSQMDWTLKIIKDADFATALSNWSGNTPADIRIGFGNATPGTVDGDLDFALHGKINAAPKDHGAIMSGNLSGRCLESDDGATEAYTITMANAVDRTW